MMQSARMPDLLPILPEVVLAIGAMLLLLAGTFGGRNAWSTIAVAAIVLLVATGVIVVWLPGDKLVTFGGSFVVDSFARFLKLLALIGSAASILMSREFLSHEKQQRSEYPVLILLSTAGMMMLISANDLIALYLGLELMSVRSLCPRSD